MKKVVLFIALVATTVVGAQAQKFQGGEKNLEVEFKPFGESPVAMPNGFRFRMFNSETSAIRVGFDIGGDTDTRVRKQGYTIGTGTTAVDLSELYSTAKSFNFAIRPGYEKHFAGTDRLSPYVGAELLFSMQSSSYEEEYRSGNTEDVQGATTSNTVANAKNWQTWSLTRSEGSTTFGLNALAGVDFYFADNFYMGAEISLGFGNTKHKNSEIEGEKDNYEFFDATINQDAIATTFSDMLAIENSAVVTLPVIGDGTGRFKNSGWGPNFQSTLRLGWLF
jgi:hypothetical protein